VIQCNNIPKVRTTVCLSSVAEADAA